MAILIAVPDDGEAQEMMVGLGALGFACERTPTGAMALTLASTCEALIADTVLPDMPGLELAQKLREEGLSTPLILLEHQCSPERRALGLEAGADDFLCKPFALLELAARLRALIRRSRMPSRARYLAVADLVWEPDLRRVSRVGQRLDLTPMEYALLSLLLERLGQVVSREEMALALWGGGKELPELRSPNALDAQVRRLRAKVDGPFSLPLLRTLRGKGMKIEAR